MESDTQEQEHRQAPEKETATGSGGLFGDLRHEHPKASSEGGQDSSATAAQPIHEASMLGQQPEQSTKANIVEQDMAHQHVRERPADQSMSDDVQHPTEQPSHPPANPVKPTSSHAPHSQEPHLHASLGVLPDPQPTALASSSQPPTQDDNPSHPDQLPPLRDAHFADEQDLVPDVRSATNRVSRPQRRRRRRSTVVEAALTHKYVFARRSSTRPTRPSAATRQYPLLPLPPRERGVPSPMGGRG